MIASTCPTGTVFPFLRCFETSMASLAQGTMFLAPTITNLDLRVSSSAGNETLVLSSFRAITRMVHIRRLALDGYLHTPSSVINAISMLKTLDHLEGFEFTAPLSVIPLMMDLLSSLPTIQRVDFTQHYQPAGIDVAALPSPPTVSANFVVT